MILFFMSANRHLCVLCGLVDAGFKEIQTIIYFIKATVDSLKAFIHFLPLT